jgi:hypothetical protein
MKWKPSLFLILAFNLNTAMGSQTFNLKVFAVAASQTTYRGVLTGDQPGIMAGPGFSFYETVHLNGPNLFYAPLKRRNAHYWRAGFRMVSPKALFKFGKTSIPKVDRGLGGEAYANYKYSFGFRNLFSAEIDLAQELISYLSPYGEFTVGIPFLPFTSLKGQISVGGKSAHQYLFGSEAVGGIGHTSMILGGFIPPGWVLPYKGILLPSLKWDWINRKENRQASFVPKNSASSWAAQMVAVWSVK